MSGAITNTGSNTLSEKLKAILPNCNRVDALVGYFYFSGFRDLAYDLKDKKIRILVGMDIDRRILEKVSTLRDVNLDSHTADVHIASRAGAREMYINDFSQVFNDTDYFDSNESQAAFKIFLDKLLDGSLEIKKTASSNHSKFYLLHYKPEFSAGGVSPGIVIEGSSNLTFSGLKGQGEHNRILQESHYYEEDVQRFEEYWSDANNIVIADIDSAKEFVQEVKKKIWLFALPKPQLLYYKVLKEYFEVDLVESSKGAGEITGGKFFDLKYQKDAIDLGIDRINKFGGVLIADVVGLGKSIVASAIANNLGLKTIIIAPPHLESQWQDYMSDFDFKGFVYSTGKIQEAFDRHGAESGKLLIILDEAHKHRNEDTDNYKILHRLCAGNRVMALSATPFNNDPRDIYALIKLFSTPGQSTLKTVENLSIAFHALFKSYRALRREMRGAPHKKKDDETEGIKEKAQKIANELRKMIEPLVIRRSRLDLEEIVAYREDLKAQGVSFAKVRDPELLEYELGSTTERYIATLNKIASTDGNASFIGARYKPAKYIREGSESLKKLLEGAKGDTKATSTDEIAPSPDELLQSLQQAQVNVAKFMRRLLVRRFESSVAAFKTSLKNMIASSELMLEWYEQRGEVPIYKKGTLPDLEELEDLDEEDVAELLGGLEDKGLIRIPKDDLDPNFEKHLRHDIDLLKSIDAEWAHSDEDPKFDFFLDRVTKSVAQENGRKIIVFTEFSDTADYVFAKLQGAGFSRVFKYSSEDSSEANKARIRANFDAGLSADKQENDYDILVATDAISEGFNLHRAGTIVNYDIPYNPTRVIQRVGRINRINKKVFDELYIWNFFPTPTGEVETHTKAISTLKMDMIHALLGEDTRIFTSDEDLKNYFAKQYAEEAARAESLSWDAKYRNDWLSIKDNKAVTDELDKIPHRSRIARQTGQTGVVAFAKNGSSYVFAFGESEETVEIVSPEVALPLFVAPAEESALETTLNFEPIYQKAKEHIFKENTKPPVEGGRKHDALGKLKILADWYPAAKDLCLDITRAVKDLDALPHGVLKDIAEIRIERSAPEPAYQELKEMVPPKYLQDIFTTADRANEAGRIMVLSEELIA